MAAPKNETGYKQIQLDLQSKNYQKLYIFYGEEDYLKERYLQRLKKAVVDETFAQFNLVEFEWKGLNAEILTEAIESYPAFSERKMVIIKDLDIYKPPASISDILPNLLSDLPDYICLVFYYDTIEYKPDKRTKLYSVINKFASVNEFGRMSENELITQISKYVRSAGKEISKDTCQYLLFLCGNSMTNLLTEIDKAISHSTLQEIKKYNIESVCTRTLDAVVFDLTDHIAAKRFDKAISILNDLIAQKNTEVMLFSAIQKHMQRMYAAKLFMGTPSANQKELMSLIGTGSSFYANKMQDMARRISINWLRKCIKICGETDIALKSSSADKVKIIEIALLEMASTEDRGKF